MNFNIIKLCIIVILIDYFYLRLVSPHFKNLVKTIQKGEDMEFRMLPAVFCYIFLIYGLYYFIINKNGNYKDAFILGFIIYGVFETTNATIFKDWDFKSILIDTIWGGILFGLSTYIYNNYLKI
tara:strand:- start:128 stop:499 length:372 start_codon:yes stop_codon:yes gene_type:complete